MNAADEFYLGILALGFLGVLIMCAGAGLMTLAERRAGRRWGK